MSKAAQEMQRLADGIWNERKGRKRMSSDDASNDSRMGPSAAANDKPEPEPEPETAEADNNDGVAEGEDAMQAAESTTRTTKKKSTAKKSTAKRSAKTSTRSAKAAKTSTNGSGRKRGVPVSGSLRDVKAAGTTYVALIFDEGQMMVTPTSNREANRDLLVKTLRALIK